MNRGTQIYVWLPSTPPTKNVILYYHLNSSFRISSASLISPIHGFSQKSFGTLPPFSTEFIPSDIAIARASSNPPFHAATDSSTLGYARRSASGKLWSSIMFGYVEIFNQRSPILKYLTCDLPY
jgi:hypothetical protein